MANCEAQYMTLYQLYVLLIRDESALLKSWMEPPVPYDEGVWFYIWCLHGSPFLRPSFVALYTGSQDTAPVYWQQSAVSVPFLSWHLGDGDESTRNWGMNFLAQEFHDLSIKFWFLEQILIQKKRNFPESWERFVKLISFWSLTIFN